ncbi:MAG: hypothetical protein K0U86_21680 [Planctomycetes bacterium]|nr:hypothetical protein [Planctomycetota bacterium]MCH9777500.1 hypothetical protein [Planctomycetota bacterium]MCH9789671.1 hypothetical protein [Planctomycetota bacterium]
MSERQHYAFLGAGAGAFFGGAGAFCAFFLGAAAAGFSGEQLEQGDASQHFGAAVQHLGAGAQQVGAGLQHTGAGAGLQQVVRTGLQQRTRAGLQQRVRTGLQQRVRTGLQQRVRTGLQHLTRSGLQQRFNKPASASDELNDADNNVSAAIIESVTAF